MAGPRLTVQVLAVLAVFLEQSDGEHFGFQISQSSGLAAGTVYPILQRLLDAGWVEERYETPGEAGGHQGPLRRYYKLSRTGEARAVNALAQGQARQDGLARLFSPRPAAGPAASDSP